MASRGRQTDQPRGAAAVSSRRRPRDIPIVPKDPVNKKEMLRFGLNAVNRDGQKWYKTHNESKYFSDFPIDADSLSREYHHIHQRCLDYQLHFLFDQPRPYNLSIVHEFYAKISKDPRTRQVNVRGVTVDFTPLEINDIIGTRSDVILNAFDELSQHPLYQSIRHTLAGPQSTSKWNRHAYRGFHQSFPFEHLNKDARVWLKIVTHGIFSGQYFFEVMRDRVCLVYALMTGMELNVGSILKSAMRKAQAHKGLSMG